MFTIMRDLPPLANPSQNPPQVPRPGLRPLWAAPLAAVPLVAISVALAGPASADPAVPPHVAGTATAVTASPSSSHEGDLVDYTAHVRLAGGTGIPTGTVTFITGGVALCNNPIALDSHGQAKCKSAKAPVGTDTVTATYSGDPGSFAASTGKATETVVMRAAALPTITSVTADPPEAYRGEAVTYLATVAPKTPGSAAVPAGTVTFTAGPNNTRLCTAIPLNGVGNAKCTSTRTPEDNNVVTATYSGDASFKPSSGTTNVLAGLEKDSPRPPHKDPSWNVKSNQPEPDEMGPGLVRKDPSPPSEVESGQKLQSGSMQRELPR